MSKPLGEIEVERTGDSIALIVRMARRWFPWDVWTIVEVGKEDGSRYYSRKDPTYGKSGFEPHRGLAQFYIDDITYYARKVGSCHREHAARRRAVKHLHKFLRWRNEQRRLERELEDA